MHIYINIAITPKHVEGMWLIYFYINVCVHFVGIFEELFTRMHGTEILKKNLIIHISPILSVTF